MLRAIITGCAVAAITGGCVARSPASAPKIIAFAGPHDPTYAVLPEYRAQLRQANQRSILGEGQFQSEAEKVLAAAHADLHFGGLVFRSVPEPHAIVMFTGDAEARLKRYTRDPRYHARSVDLTLAQLERMKDDMSVQLRYLGLRCFSVDGDEEHNRVTVRTAEMDKVRQAIATRRLKVPPKFALLPGGCDTLL